MGKYEHIQDVVGQLPFLKTYSHLLLAFPVRESKSSQAEIICQLQAACLQLVKAFPWLSAKVTQHSGRLGSSDSYILEPCDLWSPPKSLLCVRDCYNSSNSYETILAARSPASMIPGARLAPRKAFPESYQETGHDPAPVLAFQANFIRGGLLLDCAAQHNFIDMSGIEQCYNLLAAALRGEPFSEDAIAQGNLDRRGLVPLLEPHEALHDFTQFKRPKPGNLPAPPIELESPFSWRYFRFSPAALSELKGLASIPNTAGSYVSTNDALTGFCWQRVIATRLRRRRTPQAIAKFCRAVDARKAMGVPPGYMGDLVTIATSRLEFRALAEAPLAEVAGLLRRDLTAVNNRDYVRGFATFIANTPDKSEIVYGGKFNPDTDIGSSSWAHVQLAQVDFGSLGRPSLIRRPDFVPLKSDIYLMPRTESGAIDALLCFNELDFDGLMEDELWRCYADYIG